MAGGEDPVQVGAEQLRERLEGREPLPPKRQAPRGQEAAGVRLVRIGPELRQVGPEQIGLGQPAVDREEAAEGLLLVPRQVGPPGEEQPALAPHQPAEPAALPEELGPARTAPTCPRRRPARPGAEPGARPRRRTDPTSPACAPSPSRAAPASRGCSPPSGTWSSSPGRSRPPRAGATGAAAGRPPTDAAPVYRSGGPSPPPGPTGRRPVATGALVQAWATAASPRTVWWAFPTRKGTRSRWRPQRRQTTVWISTTSQTCQGPQGRSRTRRSVGSPAVAWVLIPQRGQQ
jgi:hypothetical protein